MNLLRGWLFDNLGLKLTALLLAMLVYLNVYTDRPATMLLSFTLEYTGLPDSLTLSGPSPSVVQAELRGTGKRLIGLRVKEPRKRTEHPQLPRFDYPSPMRFHWVFALAV